MRVWVVFAILVAMPGLYLFYNDYSKQQRTSSQEFHTSTLGEVWLDHDRAGFMSFKSRYKGFESDWDTYIRPYLEWKALPLALVPALLYYFWILVCWMLGRGPFSNWSSFSLEGKKSSFSRFSASERGGQMNYRRK